MPETDQPDGNASDKRQATLGFMFAHSIASDISRRLVETAAGQMALLALLEEKGLVDSEAYAKRRQAAYEALSDEIAEKGLGLFLNEQHEDKYALTDLPEIDCAARIHLCRAACCTMRFPLSRQDVEEGTVRWDFGRPYWNLRRDSGYCVHWQAEPGSCGIYAQRPGPCRIYDCRQDKRIWADFDAMTASSELADFFG